MQRFLLSMLTLSCVWFCGFLVFVYGIPQKPIDITTKTDAIVVWTGGPCRITTGVELLHHGLSDKLFVSGVEKGKPQLLSKQCNSYLSPETVEQLSNRISLGYAALSTMGNAIETSIWAERNQIQSVRLVTAAIHMPRSLVEFHLAMPHLKVIPHSVNVKQFDHRRWYASWPVFYKIAREYSKFLFIKIGIRPWWRDNILDE
ncbi:YdcF family protein [Candidatus Odyssella acanthamoebae]|uniref:YdcF family protein n=1 Tax=Candidatus Odyssella acanthamoebae TaxID=91604 RepID=UPI00068FB914|nr:YdcF family protein [Candidatus Paracaedibacter acanthamoebae]